MSLTRQVGRFIFSRLLPPGLPLPVIRGPLRGFRLILGSAAGEGRGATVYFNMMEQEQTAAVARLLRPGQVFYDIGANVGYYTLLASRSVGPRGLVIAVEPVVRNVALLQKHLALNKTSNVTTLAAACARAISIAGFSLGSNSAMGHILTALPGALRPSRAPALVPVITVDSIRQATGANPDALKIDVEGAELEVLEGAQTTLAEHQPLIFLSVHSPGLRDQCTRFLEERGYVVSSLTPADEGNELLAKPGGLW